MGKGSRDLETRMRRRRVYANFDDNVVATFELATMCSLGRDRGVWPDGLLVSLTLISQVRNALSSAGQSPTINDLAETYLGHVLGECRARAPAPNPAARPHNIGAVQ